MKPNLRRQLLKMSRLALFMFLANFTLLSLTSAGPANGQISESIQDIYLSIDVKNNSIEKVFNEIRKKTGFEFVYDKNDLNKDKLTLNVQNKSLAQLLKEVSQQTQLEFLRKNDNIIVRKYGSFESSVSETYEALQLNISGVVSDENGDPLPGATILEKGTSNGTITDVNGKYSIAVGSDNATLVIDFVGYITQEIPVNGRSVVDTQLEQDIQALSEVVVIGYGTQERAKVTGAVASVSSKDIDRQIVGNTAQALQGQAAGVNITNVGEPGEEPLIRIRGIGTINNNNPLIVIDGVPGGDLNSINPNDIESVEVLKDASTAAIYGSRGANGVILITTKKGQIGKPQITVDSYIGVQSAWKQLDLLNTDQYLDYAADLFGNANQGVPPRHAEILNGTSEFAGIDTDWQDAMFKAGQISDNNISVSGGNENVTYLVGGGYFWQDGIMLGSNFERISFRANSEYKINDRLKIGEVLTIADVTRRDDQLSGGRSQIEHMIKMTPYIPVRDPSRVGGFRAPDTPDGTDPENPVLNATLKQFYRKNLRTFGNIYAELEIIDGLSARVMYGVDLNYRRDSDFTPIYNAGSFQQNDRAIISEDRNAFIGNISNYQLSYNKVFGDHTLGVVGVFERQINRTDNVGADGTNTVTDRISALDQAQEPQVSGNSSYFEIQSLIGRLTYDFQDKYLVSASVRRDVSTRFSSEVRIGIFPSFSAGWRISEESFLEGVEFIDDLKIRGSYGETGNLNVGDYVYIPQIFGNLGYDFNDQGLQPGNTLRRLTNERLGWETTVMTNIGFDAAFFDGRLTLAADYFANTTQDMIIGVPIPFSQGYDEDPIDNVGSVENSGIEIILGYNQEIGDLSLGFNGNFSTVKNKVTALNNPDETIFGPAFEGLPLTITQQGFPIASFYGYQTDGLFQNQSEIDNHATQPQVIPGDIRFRDNNNDGQINADDRVRIGSFLPDIIYGFTFTADYKGIDLSAFFQGVAGNEIFNTNIYDLQGMTRLFNAGTAVLDRWQQEGDITDVPIARNGDPALNARVSDRYIEKGDYLRLKNLTMGYTLPNSIFGGMDYIQNVRIYFGSQNLFTITQYTGYDPEIGVRQGLDASLATGVDFGQYPQPRTFIGGIQIKL